MQELIDRLKAKADLSDEQAAKAADVMKNFLDEKLPDSLSGPMDKVLTGANVQDAVERGKSFLG
ncbi:MAG: hypothetical protein ACREMK_10590 [Gemmatimonadota bacterium]